MALIQQKLSKQVTGLILLIQLLMTRCAQSAETTIQMATTQLQSDSNFQDQIVWDADSLYSSQHANSAPSFTSNGQLFTSRRKRSATPQQNQQLVDACQSKMEILTPYYATNSKGKLRTVVNSELMQQAIQVETCVRSPTSHNAAKCNAQLDCGCEQKYKWHRLLVLDPHDSGAARGLFMDWFLFPSSCVCRCKSSQWTSKQFLRTIKRTTTTSGG